MTPAPIAASIDLDAPGKRIGYLEILWSDDEHAYGIIPVPIAVIANGNGPSVLVTAGVHGDEYEGLVIARKLIAELVPDAISGRIVIMPGVNWPAVRARRRVSPIDHKNMNRIFPGDGASGPTAMIADFIERRLLPSMAYAVDLHSGGTLSGSTPAATSMEPASALSATGSSPPRTRWRAQDRGRSDNVVRRVVVRGVRATGRRDGCRRARRRRSAWSRRDGHWLGRHAQSAAPCGCSERHAESDAHGAPADANPRLLCHGHHRRPVGHSVDLGATVQAGDLAGQIWPVDDLARPPVAIRFAAGGVVLARRTMPMVVRGDYVCHVASR